MAQLVSTLVSFMLLAARRTSLLNLPLNPTSLTLFPLSKHATAHSGVTNLAWFFLFFLSSISAFEAERFGAKM
jgi:hypothetical protein